MLKARLALGKVYCGGDRCRGQLPSPAPKEHQTALAGQVVFELDGWQPDEHGRLHRGGRRRRSRLNRMVKAAFSPDLKPLRLDAPSDDVEDPIELKPLSGSSWYEPLTVPAIAICPRCGAPNVLDFDLV